MGNCLGRCLAGKNELRNLEDEEEQLVNEDDKEENFIFKIMKFKRKTPSEFLEKFWERQGKSYSRLARQGSFNDRSPDIQLQCLDAQTLMRSSRDAPPMPSKTTTGYLNYGAGVSSRASSSLDLEWEHEYGALNRNTPNQLSQSWFFLKDDDDSHRPIDVDQASTNSVSNTADYSLIEIPARTDPFGLTRCGGAENAVESNLDRILTKTSWSHISTPESLEWDIDEEQQQQMEVEDDMLDHETLKLLHEIELLKNKVLDETGTGLGFEVIRAEES